MGTTGSIEQVQVAALPKGLPLSDAQQNMPISQPLVMGGSDFVSLAQESPRGFQQGANQSEIPGRSRRMSSLSGLDSSATAREALTMKTQPNLSAGINRISKSDLDQLDRIRTQNRESLGERGTSGMIAPPNQASLVKRLPPIEVDGYVTQGAMAQSRLSSQSIMDISHRFSSMGNNSAGLMKIKLNPESLGELALQVQTKGKDVGIKFMASSPEAKRVLEESLPYLKDNLTQSNLKLGKVEFGLMQATQPGSAVASLDGLVQESNLSRNLSDFSEGSRDLSDHRSWQEDSAGSRRRSAQQDLHEEPSQESQVGRKRGLNVLA